MPRWDEVVRVNSERLKGPALAQTPRREQGEWRRQTNPIECEARSTASGAILLSSGLFRKDFLWNAAVGAAVQHCPQTIGFSPIPTRISSNSSKIVGDRAVKAAALAELRRTDTNTAAVAQLVDFVEQIYDVEADLKASRDLRNFQITLQR